MSVEGLDKKENMEQNSKVEITGLDFCRPVEQEFSDEQMQDNNVPFIPEKLSEGQIQEISGLDRVRHITSDIQSDVPQDFSEETFYADELSEDSSVNITGLDSIKHVAEPSLPKLSTFAINLIKIVDRARELDRECRVFGADKHQYKFNSVISLSKVRDFEKRHNVTFPQAYVDFLTQVGDGGAGPDLGLYSLDEVEYNNYTDHSETSCSLEHVRARSDYYTISYTIEDKDPLVTSSLDDDKWFSWYEDLGASCIGGGNFRKKSTELYNGLVEISAMGGTNAMYLICDGDLKGKLCAFTLDIDDKVHIFDISFEDWMLNHFKRIVDKFEAMGKR